MNRPGYILAKMEHNRYLAERLMARRAFEKGRIQQKQTSFLRLSIGITWENHEWVKDLDQIEIILAFLAQSSRHRIRRFALVPIPEPKLKARMQASETLGQRGSTVLR
jgi:hypothetical protein